MMKIKTGDYVLECLDKHGNLISGMWLAFESLLEAQEKAKSITDYQWRIMRCINRSDDKERWER